MHLSFLSISAVTISLLTSLAPGKSIHGESHFNHTLDHARHSTTQPTSHPTPQPTSHAQRDTPNVNNRIEKRWNPIQPFCNQLPFGSYQLGMQSTTQPDNLAVCLTIFNTTCNDVASLNTTKGVQAAMMTIPGAGHRLQFEVHVTDLRAGKNAPRLLHSNENGTGTIDNARCFQPPHSNVTWDGFCLMQIY